MSLWFRNPQAVAEIRDHILDMWKVGLEKAKEEYEARKKPEDPPFGEYFEEHHGAVPHIEAAQFLRETMDNVRIGAALNQLHWTTIDLKNSLFSLLTSDRPAVMPLGLGDPNAYVAIPIGPHKLFVGARKPDFLSKLKSEKHIKVVKAINKAVVEQAREYVWGGDASQLSFVEKHFGKTPDRIIIDEDIKAKAMAAARGELAQDSQSPKDADPIALD